MADALCGLANEVERQLGTQGQLCIHDVISDTTHHICSSLIQRAGSVQGVPYGYPTLLELAQYLVKVSVDTTWHMSARDLARSCISRLISTIKALLLELHDAESHTNPDFRASLKKIRVRILSLLFIFCLPYALYWRSASRRG